MPDAKYLPRAIALAVLLGAAAGSPTAIATDDIWDLMNPAWWMGLDDDDDWDDWDYWVYGPGRYYHGGPYGWGGGPYGWGGGPYGGGYPGWAQGGYPAQAESAEPEPAPPPKLPE